MSIQLFKQQHHNQQQAEDEERSSFSLFHYQKHVEFILTSCHRLQPNNDDSKDDEDNTNPNKTKSNSSYEAAMTQHLRMSGIYWAASAFALLLPSISSSSVPLPNQLEQQQDEQDHSTTTTSTNTNTTPSMKALYSLNDLIANNNKTLFDAVMECYNNNNELSSHGSGFAGCVQDKSHPHLLYTLSALQLLALDRKLSLLDHDKKEAIITYVCSLQQPDGSFVGDGAATRTTSSASSHGAEVDTRFTYCAVSCLALLGALHRIDQDKAAAYIMQCRNHADGGFGNVMGAESHAGQVFCCVGALSILQRLDYLLQADANADTLSWWLSERQVDSGGLNGRPEKQADVCYSWWILSALAILGRLHWISGQKLAKFILLCQDDQDGGIADRPGDMPDVYHTFFGIAGLSLLEYLPTAKSSGADQVSFSRIDPVYALPTDIVQELNLPGQVLIHDEDQEPLDDRLDQYSKIHISNK